MSSKGEQIEEEIKKINENKKKEFNEIFSKRVRSLRKSKGYTQEKLAEESNIARSYIGHIEQERKCVTIFMAKKIAKGLGITLSELFQGL